MAKIKRKYSKFVGELHYVCLNKGTNGLGLSLAGHKDRRQVKLIFCLDFITCFSKAVKN